MTPEHEQHLQYIKDELLVMLDKKYRAGNAQHGGKLWLKTGLIDMAIEEAIDQVVYLLTLKEQLDE